MRLLVVEDEAEIAESLTLLLEFAGHEVVVASSGRGALEVVEKHLPDVALIDIGLPDIDGYEVARQFRKRPAFKAISLVALSGYGRDEDILRGREAGFEHHLTKPTDPKTLERLLGSIASARQ
jgi:CheY-like chemotaxis protein